jgi:hypothetical protein
LFGVELNIVCQKPKYFISNGFKKYYQSEKFVIKTRIGLLDNVTIVNSLRYFKEEVWQIPVRVTSPPLRAH